MPVAGSKIAGWGVLASLLLVPATLGRAATVTEALALSPMQDDVDYDQPDSDEQKQCKLDSQLGGVSGWIVKDPAGRLLRRFLDTNGDNRVDQWCYYKEGVEVYRDIDANFNGKADQYRWMGTAGIRWALDKNEDNTIDDWKMISAEEVTAEVVAALKNRDSAQFKRLVITSEELTALGLSKERTAALSKRVAAANSGFANLAGRQQVVRSASKWIHFGGSRPGIVPAGTDGSKKDLVVYDNVSAVVETDGTHSQVAVGTLIRVGDKWRLIDLPHNLLDGQLAATPGFFFNAAMSSAPETDTIVDAGLTPELQKLMAEFQSVETSLAKATSTAARSKLYDQRCDVLEKLIAAVPKDERANWVRQFADATSAGFQTGDYPGGLKRLAAFYQKLAKDPAAGDVTAYIKYRYLGAEYSHSLQDPQADYAKIQKKWLEDLRQFVQDYPKSEDAADAMQQLALAQEFAGETDDAKKWYARIVNEFPSSQLAKKAGGAKTRLESVGRSIVLRGKTIHGKPVDLSDYRGKVVLVHYWSTWCEPCKAELATLKNLQAKYGRQGFELIGISLDNNRDELAAYLQSNRLAWPQLHEEGGLDSRFATELGILTLPTMMLIDKQGKVVNRNIHATELDAELQKQLR